MFMRYPNYKEAHAKAEKERLEKERLEQWRNTQREWGEEYKQNTPNYFMQAQQQEQQNKERERRRAQQNIMEEMIKRIINGPPPSLRVIANIGPSTYDFTITKMEEIEMVQVLLHKFLDALTTKI